MRQLLISATFLGASMASAQTRSQINGTDLVKSTMTVYVQADTQMATYDSKSVASKESKALNSYTLGAWAGEERNFGLAVSSSDNTVAFSLNNSSVKTAHRDVRAKARFGWVVPQVAATVSEIDVQRASGEHVADLFASGVGAGVGVYVPFSDQLNMFAEAMLNKTTRIQERENRDVTLGDRSNIEMGTNIQVLPRVMDILVGYRYSAYNLGADGEDYSETTQGAFAGLRLGLYF